MFRGNFDQHSIVVGEIFPPIRARFIRIHPLTWQNDLCMRVELFGCPIRVSVPTQKASFNQKILSNNNLESVLEIYFFPSFKKWLLLVTCNFEKKCNKIVENIL